MLRQPSESTSRPDRAGPTAGAKPMTMPERPSACPCRSGGQRWMSTIWRTGMSTPAPQACTARDRSSTGKDGAKRDSAQPAAKSSSDASSRRRVRTRWNRSAVSTVMTPRIRR